MYEVDYGSQKDFRDAMETSEAIQPYESRCSACFVTLLEHTQQSNIPEW